MAGSHKRHLAFFGLAHVIGLPLLFQTIYRIPYSSIGIYFDFASKVLNGNLPYRDFPLEYPPFALVFFILPRLFTSNYRIYSIIFQIEAFIFEVLGLYIVYLIARRLGKTPWKMLTVYTIAILAIGPIFPQSYDIFTAVTTLLALYCFWVGKHKTSWVLLAIGAMAKIYPAALAPVFLAYYLRKHEYKRILPGVLAFGASCLIILAPFLVTSPASLLSLINYHAQRGIQLESTYSSFLLVADKLNSTRPPIAFGAGSWNVGGQAAETLASISTFVLVFLVLAVYWLIYRRIKAGKIQISELGAYSMLVISVILITSKILSPQYLIWLFPLLPLISGSLRNKIRVVFVAVGALTYIIFPLNYVALIDLNTSAVCVLLVRDIFLIILAALIGISLYRSKMDDPISNEA